MKKHATPYLLVLLFAIALLACEKATFTLEQSPALTIEQRFHNLKKPRVLYQYTSVDLKSGEESGWVIDAQGKLRTYSRTLSPGSLPVSEHEIWTAENFDNLYALTSGNNKNIDIEDLFNRFRQSKRLHPGFLSSPRVYQDESRASAFYVYTPQEAGIDNVVRNWCKTNAEDFPPGTELHNRIVLDMSGYIDRHGNSKEARELLEWMKELDRSLSH